jgi:hypothetical protein
MDDIKGLTPHASRVNGTVSVVMIPWRFTYLCWNIRDVVGRDAAGDAQEPVAEVSDVGELGRRVEAVANLRRPRSLLICS